MGAQPVLEHGGRDVLAGRGDDEVLLAPGDREEPLVVEDAEVAGVQPAVLVDHLLGGGLVVPVALEDHVALDEDLAVRRDPDRAARDRPAHGADLLRVGRVGVGRGAGLGQAVALEDGDAARRGRSARAGCRAGRPRSRSTAPGRRAPRAACA